MSAQHALGVFGSRRQAIRGLSLTFMASAAQPVLHNAKQLFRNVTKFYNKYWLKCDKYERIQADILVFIGRNIAVQVQHIW